jgi:hypothetical protein
MPCAAMAPNRYISSPPINCQGDTIDNLDMRSEEGYYHCYDSRDISTETENTFVIAIVLMFSP